MPKLTRNDWKMLRNKHRAAFTGLTNDLFTLLLDKLYEGSKDPDEVDEIDALMIYLARAEPPIPPTG
jgi:hypothetical protein